MTNDDDAALIHAARVGSPIAFTRLVDRHQQAVRNFLRRLALNWDDADDIAQETFVAAWRALGSWRGQASVRTWLCAIAWNKAKSARRASARQAARDDAYAQRSTLEQGAEVRAEDRIALTNALADLPLDQRAAVALCLGEEFSHAEAAQILNLPLGTVKSHVARGRARLLAALGEKP